MHYHHLATRDAAILRNRLATTASVFAFALALALIITFGVKFHLQDVQEKKTSLENDQKPALKNVCDLSFDWSVRHPLQLCRILQDYEEMR